MSLAIRNRAEIKLLQSVAAGQKAFAAAKLKQKQLVHQQLDLTRRALGFKQLKNRLLAAVKQGSPAQKLAELLEKTKKSKVELSKNQELFAQLQSEFALKLCEFKGELGKRVSLEEKVQAGKSQAVALQQQGEQEQLLETLVQEASLEKAQPTVPDQKSSLAIQTFKDSEVKTVSLQDLRRLLAQDQKPYQISEVVSNSSNLGKESKIILRDVRGAELNFQLYQRKSGQQELVISTNDEKSRRKMWQERAQLIEAMQRSGLSLTRIRFEMS